MFNLGTTELIIVLVVLLLLFGSRLPSVMRGLGKSVTEFKKGMSEITDDALNDSAPKVQTKEDDHSEETPAG